MSRIFIKKLGVDFGSSKTTIVGISDTNQLFIFENPKNEEPTFPSVIGSFPNSDEYYYFEDAYVKTKYNERGEKISLTIINNLKEGLYNRIDGKASEENVARYFREIFKRLKDRNKNANPKFDNVYDFSSLDTVFFGHPAYHTLGGSKDYIKAFTPIIKSIVTNTFELKSEPAVKAYPEPVLAAIAYNYCASTTEEYKNAIKQDDVVLVLDFGGHTMDISLLKAERSGNKLRLAPYKKSCSIDSGTIQMGKAITRRLCAQIYRDMHCDEDHYPFDHNVDKAKCAFFSSEISSPVKCLYEMDDIKNFVLEYNCNRRPAIDKKSQTVYIGLNNGERNIDIEEKIFRSAIQQIRRYVCADEIALPKKSISHILFTGGSSNIPQLRKYIKTALRAPDIDVLSNDYNEFIMDKIPNSAIKISNDCINIGTRKEISLSSANAVAVGAALVAREPRLTTIIDRISGATDTETFKQTITELKNQHQRVLNKGNRILDNWRCAARKLDALSDRAIAAISDEATRESLRSEYNEISTNNVDYNNHNH